MTAFHTASNPRIVFPLGEWRRMVVALMSDSLSLAPPTDGNAVVTSRLDLAARFTGPWLAVTAVILSRYLVKSRWGPGRVMRLARHVSHGVYWAGWLKPSLLHGGQGRGIINRRFGGGVGTQCREPRLAL